MSTETYLDHGSGSPMSAPAREAMLAALDTFGDPLRFHATGRAALRLLEESRAAVASALGAQPDEIVFTSGGTESVALGIWGGVRSRRELGDRIVVSAVEHPAVDGIGHTLETDGFLMVRVPVDGFGRTDIDAFAAEVRRPGTLLASVQHANHETGTMHAVAEAARLSREAGVVFHTDACQTVGRLPVDAEAIGVDLLSLSGHKFEGPPGVGALYVRRGVHVAAYPCGDDRERKRRSGMENTPGIAAMAAALTAALADVADRAARQWSLNDLLRAGIEQRVPGARVHGHPTHRAPHMVCFSVPDVDAEVLAMALDDRGFRLAVGSMCSGAANDASPVLEAMGVQTTPSFRIGLGPETTKNDVVGFLDELPEAVEELRKMEAASSEALARFRQNPES